MAKSKTITKYTGSETTITLPTSINSGLVRGLASDAFDSSLTQITMNMYSDEAPVGEPWGATNAKLVYRDKTIEPPGSEYLTGDFIWDGDTTGLTRIDIYDGEEIVESYYKVSDKCYQKDYIAVRNKWVNSDMWYSLGLVGSVIAQTECYSIYRTLSDIKDDYQALCFALNVTTDCEYRGEQFTKGLWMLWVDASEPMPALYSKALYLVENHSKLPVCRTLPSGDVTVDTTLSVAQVKTDLDKISTWYSHFDSTLVGAQLYCILCTTTNFIYVEKYNGKYAIKEGYFNFSESNPIIYRRTLWTEDDGWAAGLTNPICNVQEGGDEMSFGCHYSIYWPLTQTSTIMQNGAENDKINNIIYVDPASVAITWE